MGNYDDSFDEAHRAAVPLQVHVRSAEEWVELHAQQRARVEAVTAAGIADVERQYGEIRRRALEAASAVIIQAWVRRLLAQCEQRVLLIEREILHWRKAAVVAAKAAAAAAHLFAEHAHDAGTEAVQHETLKLRAERAARIVARHAAKDQVARWLQAHYRGAKGRGFAWSRGAVVEVALSVARLFMVRQSAAVQIQCAARCAVARREVRIRRYQRNMRCALVVQCAVRMRRAMVAARIRYLERCEEATIQVQTLVRTWLARRRRVVMRALKELEDEEFDRLGFQEGAVLAAPAVVTSYSIYEDENHESPSFELPWLNTSSGWKASNEASRRDYSKDPEDLEAWYEANKQGMRCGKLVANPGADRGGAL
jgi:hypothetical protein